MASRNRIRISDSRALQTGVTKHDTLVNFMSGMGTDRDKMTGVFFGMQLTDHAQLMNAYRADWLARKIVDIPANDSTREWRSWQADQTDITAIENVEKDFAVQLKVRAALKRARLFGGAAIIMGVDQGAPDEPLDVEAVSKDSLKFLHVVSRHEVNAGPPILDIMSPWYGEPSYYERTSVGANSTAQTRLKLHPSRVVRMLGAEIPDLNVSQGWGDSVLQIVQDAIKSTGTVANSIAQLVNEAKIDIVSIPELSEQISNKQYEERLKARFGMASILKSVFSTLLIDKEEQWNRIEQSFNGMDAILQMYLLMASAAADIPATRFLGQSPAGLNSTGESDIRNYYDRLSSEQKNDLTPAMKTLDEVIVRSALGSYPDGLFYEWNPLWQMTEKEKAEIAKSTADTFNIDRQSGLLSDIVLKKARENQLIESGFYPGFEQILEEFDDDEDLLNPDEPDVEILPPEGDDTLPEQTSGENQPPTPPTGAPRRRQTGAQSRATGAPVRDSMARRVRVHIDDARPRTAYVRRDVLNGNDILKWAKSQGFTSTLRADELHVTVAYVKQPFNWLQVGADSWGEDQGGGMTVNAGGPRMMERFDGGATVLVFASNALGYRHRRIHEVAEVEPAYQEFNPHITLTYVGAPKNIDKIKPYMGKIVLGPEVWEEIDMTGNKPEDYKTR